jgi:outer membrane protein assembly factor BamB
MLRGAGRAALVVAVLAVSGCFWQVPGARWNRSGYNDLESRITVDTVAGLEQRWEATLDDGPAGAPVTSTRGVHVNDTSSVYAFDTATGAELWQHTDEVYPRVYQPYVWDDRLLVNHGDAGENGFKSVVELDSATGETTRQISGESDLAHLAAVRGDTALLLSDQWMDTGPGPFIYQTSFIEMDLATGGTRRIGPIDYGLVPPYPDDYTVTLAGDWVVHSGRGMNPPSYGEGVRGYSISNPDTTCDFNYREVCPNWATAEGVGGPVLSGDGTLVYDTSRAYETATGDVLWERSTGTGGTPALAAGVLYVADDDGMLHAYSVDGSPQAGCTGGTCDPLWSASLGFAPDLSLQPAVAGAVVFVAGTGGELAAFDAAGCGSPPCTSLWTASVGSQITGSPAVSNGQLYVGTADGRLVAFGLPAA